jgi:hypothetical protein
LAELLLFQKNLAYYLLLCSRQKKLTFLYILQKKAYALPQAVKHRLLKNNKQNKYNEQNEQSIKSFCKPAD